MACRYAGINKNSKAPIKAPILDQLNFVIGALILASIVMPLPLSWIAILVILTPFGHLLVNKTGYLLKMKDVPW